MAHVYINAGDSFEYNEQLGDQVVLNYLDGTVNDLSDISETYVEPEEPEEHDEPVEPEEPEEPESNPTVYKEPTCTSSSKKLDNTLPRHTTTSSSGICLTHWHSNFSKCFSFAKSTGRPLVCVWSNGKNCGKCVTFENAVSNKTFQDFMNTYKPVWCFVTSSDSDGKIGSNAYNFCWGKAVKGYRSKALTPLQEYPFCCFYWYKGGKTLVDSVATGTTMDGGSSGATGAKKVMAYVKNVFKNYVSKYGYNTKTGEST